MMIMIVFYLNILLSLLLKIPILKLKKKLCDNDNYRRDNAN